jgi:hypothetical protein
VVGQQLGNRLMRRVDDAPDLAVDESQRVR